MNTAQKIKNLCYEEEEYCRCDADAISAGGKEIYNSNNPAGDAGVISWSPTIVYQFPDGSAIYIAYQESHTLSPEQIGYYQKDHAEYYK